MRVLPKTSAVQRVVGLLSGRASPPTAGHFLSTHVVRSALTLSGRYRFMLNKYPAVGADAVECRQMAACVFAARQQAHKIKDKTRSIERDETGSEKMEDTDHLRVNTTGCSNRAKIIHPHATNAEELLSTFFTSPPSADEISPV